MSLSCECHNDDESDWYWEVDDDYSKLSTKNRRKCLSCKTPIAVGALSLKVFRFRDPRGRCNYIEESIFGDRVPLAPWFFCETCADLFFNLEELGFCVEMPSNMRELTKEYAELYGKALT